MMFFRFIVSAACMLLVSWAVSALAGAKASRNSNTIVLTKRNTISLRMPVTATSVGSLQSQAMKLSDKLSSGEPLYFYLDTPGGSVVDGDNLISTLAGLPREVKTITNFAASMGFITVQSLGERLIMPNGTLMAHRASGGSEGQIPGNLNTRDNYWLQRMTTVETNVATRMGLTLPDYRKLTADEYWVYGSKAISDHAADRTVYVVCGKDLQGQYSETVPTMMGNIKVTWSECPLIGDPVAISFGDLNTRENSVYDIENLKRLTYEAFKSKQYFAQDYGSIEAFGRLFK